MNTKRAGSIYKNKFSAGNRDLWEFGWAYGVGWGAAIFLFGAIVLLLCDQEEEDIYYKERTIIHADNDSRCVKKGFVRGLGSNKEFVVCVKPTA